MRAVRRRVTRWSAVGTVLMTAVAVMAGIPSVPRWWIAAVGGVGALAFLLSS